MRLIATSLLAISLFASAYGCSSSNDSTPETPQESGKKLVTSNACASCHGGDLSGSTTGVPGYPNRNAPNITPDKDTGVGGWTDAQLTNAITKGTDDEDATLCFVMPRFTNLSSTDVANVIAYLHTVPAVSKDIPDSECPTDGGAADASKD